MREADAPVQFVFLHCRISFHFPKWLGALSITGTSTLVMNGHCYPARISIFAVKRMVFTSDFPKWENGRYARNHKSRVPSVTCYNFCRFWPVCRLYFVYSNSCTIFSFAISIEQKKQAFRRPNRHQTVVDCLRVQQSIRKNFTKPNLFVTEQLCRVQCLCQTHSTFNSWIVMVIPTNELKTWTVNGIISMNISVIYLLVTAAWHPTSSCSASLVLLIFTQCLPCPAHFPCLPFLSISFHYLSRILFVLNQSEQIRRPICWCFGIWILVQKAIYVNGDKTLLEILQCTDRDL